NWLGVGNDLLLDARRCEQQIDDRRFRLARTSESYRRQAADSLLLDDGRDRVASAAERVDQCLSARVVGYGNRHVGVSREPRFGTDGNGQAADERKCDAAFGEIGVNLAQCGFEGGHAKRFTSTGRPGQSPNSAPGRCLSHSPRSRSISASPASGCLRRRFWRIRFTPVSNKSSVVRNASVTERMATLWPVRRLEAGGLFHSLSNDGQISAAHART